MMNKLQMSFFRRVVMAAVFGAVMTAGAAAQFTAHPVPSRLDVAVTYTADSTNPVYGSNQWLNGGSAELGGHVWGNLEGVAKVTGVTTNSLGRQGVPLKLAIATFGPRYRMSYNRWSVYGESLIGVAHGFHSVFPGPMGATDSATSLALQLGGGVDWRMTEHFGIRPVEASWLRTQLPNGTTNVQNHFLIGAGGFFRF